MVSAFIFSGFPLGLNFVGQFLEIKRSDKTGAKIVDSVRQEYSHFHAVLSGEINHSRVSGVIAYYAAGPKLLAQVFRNLQSCGAIGQHIGGIKIFNTLFFADKVNNFLYAQPKKSATGPRGQTHKALCFIENSLCFLRHFLIRLNSTRYRPNNLIFDKKRHPSTCGTSTDSNLGRIIKLRQVFNADEICLIVEGISRSSPRLGPITLNELKRFFIQTGAAMRANVFRTKHD